MRYEGLEVKNPATEHLQPCGPGVTIPVDKLEVNLP